MIKPFAKLKIYFLLTLLVFSCHQTKPTLSLNTLTEKQEVLLCGIKEAFLILALPSTHLLLTSIYYILLITKELAPKFFGLTIGLTNGTIDPAKASITDLASRVKTEDYDGTLYPDKLKQLYDDFNTKDKNARPQTDSRSYFLQGHPGAGKSMFPEVFALKNNCNLYKITSELKTGYEGSYIKNIRAVFAHAENIAKTNNNYSVIVIDEIDSLFSSDQEGSEVLLFLHGYLDDDIKKKKAKQERRVFLFATANYVESDFLKQASFFREGRMEKIDFTENAIEKNIMHLSLANFFTNNDLLTVSSKVCTIQRNVLTFLLQQETDGSIPKYQFNSLLDEVLARFVITHTLQMSNKDPLWQPPCNSFISEYNRIHKNFLDQIKNTVFDNKWSYFFKQEHYSNFIQPLETIFTDVTKELLGQYFRNKKDLASLKNFNKISCQVIYNHSSETFDLQFQDPMSIRTGIKLLTKKDIETICETKEDSKENNKNNTAKNQQCYQYENILENKDSLKTLRIISEKGQWYEKVYLPYKKTMPT